MKSVRILAVAVGASFIAFASPASAQTSVAWVAPAEAAAAKNPFAGNAAEAAAGKQIFVTTCAACHGNTGRGDGPAAAALNPKPANYTTAAVAAESDGSLFWKLSEGRGAMAPFKSAFSEKQRWELITYIRTLGTGKLHATPALPVSRIASSAAKVPTPAEGKSGVLPETLPSTHPGALSGIELWSIHCNRCHTYRASNEFTAAQWQNILLHMRVRAGLPAAQAREILKYLQQGAGK